VKLIPAIDLKDNKCIRLTKGKEQSAIIYNDNPIEQAKFFEDQGCERIHIIDLDAAFGRPGINKETIINIIKSVKIPIQLGGGIRSKKDAKFWLERNIDYLIIGSLAVKNYDLVKEIAEDFKNKIYVSIDVLINGFSDQVMIDGWVENSKLTTLDINQIYEDSNIRGYIITDISRDGTMEGLNLRVLYMLLDLLKKQTIIGGGLSSYKELKALKFNTNITKDRITNLEGVILGKAFYLGEIEIKKGIKILNDLEGIKNA
jgi:phosphoribosylformimino-5-aminoimidazole carboxamide ribotide isomerase